MEQLAIEPSSQAEAGPLALAGGLEIIALTSLGELTAPIIDKWNSVGEDMRLIGGWLLEIRDHKLWHPEHSSFEEFCAKSLPFGKRRANQLIEAGCVAKKFKGMISLRFFLTFHI